MLKDLEEDINDFIQLNHHDKVVDVCKIYEHDQDRNAKWTFFSSDVFTPDKGNGYDKDKIFNSIHSIRRFWEQR